MTQSAVSHQVRALEEELGVRLFVRLTRELRLTSEGETLLAVLRQSFDRIEDTVDELKAGSGALPLRVSLTSYLAARWFTRRLGRFSARHPEVEVHLRLSNDDIDLRREDLDVAIMWGYGDWPDLSVSELMSIQLIAVCSAALLASGPAVERIEDLNHYPVLHESGRGLWEHYLTSVGAASVRPDRNIVMDDPNVLHQACLEGQGVALGAEALLADELEQGLLVRLFPESVGLGGYYVVRSPNSGNRPNVTAFHDWLMDEVA